MTKTALFLLLVLQVAFADAQFFPEEIDIMRDKWGVPHIYAPSDAQVSYGLAWAHSEDDFKTIQLTMLAAKQMLGRHLGKSGAPVDYVVGLLQCKEIVEKHIGEVAPDFMKIVEGYTAGLNAYAKNHPEEVLLKKSFPITVEEVFRAYVLQLAVFDGADDLVRDLFASKVDPAYKGTGSNAIAVSRSKTADDNVFLAVNAHQPLEGPVGWYEAHLISDEGWNMLGGLFPGGPTVFHGTNENLGWAHTVNYPDKLDVFQLEVDPKDDNQYRFDDEWLTLDHRKVKLKVKIWPGLKITVKRDAYQSVYGPVVKNEDGVFAFRLAVFDEIRATEQWYRMNKATNLKEFKKALEMTAIPGFNIVYADKEDNIFYVSNGKIPMRDPDYDWKETLPGNTSKTLSKSYHPFQDLPQLTNPKAGYLFNTNNTPFNATASDENLKFEDHDKTMGFVERENNRSTRFMQLIDQYDQLTWEDFLSVKYDATLPDSLIYGININAVFRMDASDTSRASQIARLIQGWDRSAEIDRVGAAQFHIFYYHLRRRSNQITKENVTSQEMMASLDYTYKYLMKFFGRIDVKFGEYQKLVRGNKELPLRGMPDVLSAMYARSHTDGKIKGYSGESYIMMVRYPKDNLPIIETVHAYGASSKPESPHYNDQMEMFVNLERKPMTLDLERVRKEAVKTYHPK